MIGILTFAAAMTVQAVPPPILVQAPPVTVAASPAAVAAAERFLDLIHLDRQYDSIFSRMIPVMTVQVFTSLKDNVKMPAKIRAHLADPAKEAEAERVFADEVMKGFRARYAAMRTATAREYATVFTAEELGQLVAFYQTPLGQKTLAVLPTLQGKLFPIGMAAGREVGEIAMRRTFERLDLTSDRKPAA